MQTNAFTKLKNIINIKTCDFVINNKSFIINYSKKLGQPLWASYILNKKHLDKLNGGRKNFTLDKQLEKNNIYQLNPHSDIFRNNWTRGHLIPSYLMSWDKTKNGDWSRTYNMSNIIPQNQQFNMENWNWIERKTIDIIYKTDFDTIIITGAHTDISNESNNILWFDKYNNFVYYIPNFMYQIIFTHYDLEPKCFIGFNNSEQKIYNIKFKSLESIIGNILI